MRISSRITSLQTPQKCLSSATRFFTMAPKNTLNPTQKRALCVQWLQRSGVAHTLKDLEKALPSVASINSMAVKEYIQSMTDENEIRVEKIGSGNWYWIFLSDKKLQKEGALEKARGECERVKNVLEEVRRKVEEARESREEEEGDGDGEMLMDGCGMDRSALTKRYAVLEKEVGRLRVELAKYSDDDPVELERRRASIEQEKGVVETLTDMIYNMEGWYKKQAGGDKAQFLLMKKNWYGDEFDDELGGLRDI